MAPTPTARMWLRFALLLVPVAATVVLATRVGVPEAEEVRAAVDRLGAAGLLGFVLAYALYTLLLLPKGVMSAAAGLLYGLAGGVALAWIASMIGATLGFWLGRALGRDAVERLAGPHLAGFDRMVQRHGVAAVVLARLAPVIPFTAVNYAAGLTAIPFRSFVLGTAVGIIPGTIAYVALGAYGTDPGSWEFATAVGALLAVSVVGVLVRRRRTPTPPHPSPSDPMAPSTLEDRSP